MGIGTGLSSMECFATISLKHLRTSTRGGHLEPKTEKNRAEPEPKPNKNRTEYKPNRKKKTEPNRIISVWFSV